MRFRILALALTATLSYLPPASSEESAASIMENAIEHLKGPPGKMIVGEGDIKFPGGHYALLTARHVNLDNKEGVQVDFISATADGVTGLAGAGRQWRGVRDGEITRLISYFPSLRRGRNIPYDPFEGILGSEQKFYFLPLASVLQDFSYTLLSKTNNTTVLKGMRISPNVPFPSCMLELAVKESAYVPLSLTCECKEICTGIMSQNFSDYVAIEGTSGYWAPGKIRAGSSTIITFTYWEVQEPPDWILSSSPASLGGRYILLLRKKKND